jgi:two-component system, OmpR family, sensor histidine kinase BaeS
MRLRVRLAVASVAVTLPLLGALSWSDTVAHHRAAERMLTGFMTARLPLLRDACEATPERWGGPLPPPAVRMHEGPPGEPPRPPPPPPPTGIRGPRARPAEAFAYDETFRSRNPSSPSLPPAVVRDLGGRDSAIVPFRFGSDDVEVLLRTPWGTGPCAYVLARGSIDASWGALLPDTDVWLLPVLAVLAAVLLAVGPVVRRIRQLTNAVQRSASTAYTRAVAIDGHDEIADLARAFDAAAGQVRAQLDEKERRERALREFLANTTHDVMIPLTVLQGHLATLRDDAAAGRTLQPGVIGSAMDEAHYLASLVHNLAAAARLDMADVELQLSELDLAALVARVIARHRPIARERQIALESATPPDGPRVEADMTLLEQAVSNVVFNAIRYNRAGGHVAVILEAPAADRFSLRVLDDGPGIPAAQLATLATRGARGDEARTRAPEGQGLGLHIAYRAAALHGLSLTLQPSEYGGLEVRLEGALARAQLIAAGADAMLGRCASEPSPPPATSRRCARAARCQPSSKPTTSAPTCSSSAAPRKASRRSSPS